MRRLLILAVLLGALAVGVTVALLSREEVREPRREPAPAPAPISGKVVRLERKSFVCDGTRLDLDLLKVYNPPDHAVRGPCTGVIRRLEIDTWTEDGLKMGSRTHDLQVLGGYIRCHDRAPVVHQDGIHDMGSSNVTIRNVEVSCFSSNHSALFLNQGTGSPKPVTNFIFENGILRTGPKQAQNNNNAVHIAGAENSGVRNSEIYDDAIRGDSPTLVNEDNVFHPAPGPTWKPPCTDGCPALTDGR